jgi:hypothetical protein
VQRTHIMIHHSLTRDTGTVSWAAIEKYHRETEGWRDIGYHAGVELVTDPAGDLARYAYQGLVGRPEGAQASACPQGEMNSVALHVCCVGNFDLAPPPLALLERLASRFLLPWMAAYGIPPARIVGHRDYNPAKSCPGSRFDLDLLRRMVQ